MRVRFAPSPTGNLHIGSVRTCLFNWVLAKHMGGAVILRIEDTDLQRSKPEFEANILDGLEWLGLGMDEGPNESGAYGPYRQSERIEKGVYREVADTLLASGHAYYCFETQEELEAEKKEAESKGVPYKYSRKSLGLSNDDIQKRLGSGDPYTIRFKIPEGETVVVNDGIRGEVSFDTTLLSDFVILKSDGSPAYNFAVVVDDAAMKITHVIRGEDHLSNTPRQLLLFKALGYEAPVVAHLPMMLGTDRSKLSKRHGAQSVSDYRDQGYLPEALINYLSLLGWSPPDEKELLSRQELIDLVSMERISKSGAIFDEVKLRWMNGQYIRQLSAPELRAAITPFISDEITARLGTPSEAVLEKMIVSVKDNLEVLTDINTYLEVYELSFEAFELRVSEFSVSDSDREVLSLFLEELETSDKLDSNWVDATLARLLEKTGFGKGKVFKPVRLGSTGMGSGPHLGDVLPLLGKDKIQERVSYLLSK
ncbi:glutamate--tRNA ligase [Candidatus Marinamargulisbacteria bacterium SCGC AG-439-L15]|nr:glutamate--tRNA ligase [Candidatus Marinamargulisbacteria bacterium SCGC AG-439-L15]